MTQQETESHPREASDSTDNKPMDPRKRKRLEAKRRKDEQRARIESKRQRISVSSPNSPTSEAKAPAASQKTTVVAPSAGQQPRAPLPEDAESRIGILFSALDTWFFRESRPHNTIGAAELCSQFPPPARTLAGALRSLVGEQAGADWARYRRNGKDDPLAKIIGYSDDLAPLQIDGPWPVLNGKRLYPAPAFLLKRAGLIHRLAIGSALDTDLGRMRLPVLPKGERGAKPLTDHWISETAMANVLAGGTPKAVEIREDNELFHREPRLGIARDNLRRTADEHMLYQTQHLRPRPELAIEIGVRGLDPAYRPHEHSVQRLGGEGRLAALELLATPAPWVQLAVPTPPTNAAGLLLILLTPADLGDHWLPGKFTAEKQNDVQSWRGKIAGIELRLHTAVLGKARREGGWDLTQGKQGAPRPVRSLVPAGSAWYCTLEGGNDNDLANAMRVLNGHQIGDENSHRLGRGLLTAGIWPEHDLTNPINRRKPK